MTTNKINNWAVINLLTSYLKRNRVIIVSIFLLPLIFILSLSLNYQNTFASKGMDGSLMLMLLWLVQSASFAIQTFLTILLDFKQTVIYRRIGLTRIKRLDFLVTISIFNLILMLISDLFIFIVVLIIGFAFHFTTFISTIFSWHIVLIILFTLACSFLLTSVAILMSTIIKTRTGQTISGIIVNLLIIVPLFLLIFFLNALNATSANLIALIGVGGIVGIFVGAFAVIISITAGLYFLSWKNLKWYE